MTSRWRTSAKIGGLVLVLAACSSGEVTVHDWAVSGGSGDDGVVQSYDGADHCEWQDVTFLHITAPLPGEDPATAPSDRQYVRDPEGRLVAEVQETYLARAELPADAQATGFTGPQDEELWVSADTSDALVYVVRPDMDRVEAWPRTTQVLGCD